MSHLRIATTRIAATLPKGDPTRRKLLAAVVEAAKAENPAQRAIWNAWDAMAGVEKIRDWDSFDGRARDFAGDISTMYDVLEGSSYMKLGEHVERRLNTLDKQSRSWRVAYNMWLEGRDINVDRIAADMGKSLKIIKDIEKSLNNLGHLARDYPEVWDETSRRHSEALSSAKSTASAFNNTIGVLKSGKY